MNRTKTFKQEFKSGGKNKTAPLRSLQAYYPNPTKMKGETHCTNDIQNY